MQGRNGPDALSRALSYASLALLVLAVILQAAGAALVGRIFWWIALAVMVASYWRMLSKNIGGRSRENNKYLSWRGKAQSSLRRALTRIKQLKTHRFFKCPACGQRVRTPRGKGKIRITCPKCGEAFIRKS